MGPATVILLVYAIILTIGASIVFTRMRGASASVGESLMVATLAFGFGVLLLTIFYTSSLTIHTNSWDF